MEEMLRLPCTIMRGGTSKGIFLETKHLPHDPAERDKWILAVFGSPDVRQIDGLGGADPLTSKLAIIGPSTHPDADVDYTFGQVSIDKPYIDYSGNCGNISSAVGPYAIEKGYVEAGGKLARVSIHNTNTGKLLFAEVETAGGKARVTGDCKIDGVPGTGSKILMDFSDTAGSSTGKLLPTGNEIDVIQTSFGAIEASIVDVANPCVFIRARDIGKKGTEFPGEINGDKELLQKLEEIRALVTVLIGMAPDVAAATAKSPAFPMIAMVAPPEAYTDFTTGATIDKGQVDLLSRLMFMQVLHKAYPGTGTACTGAAARIPGTIVHEVTSASAGKRVLRIGHPAGVIEVEAAYEDGKVTRAAFARTARMLMDGNVYVETARLSQK